MQKENYFLNEITPSLLKNEIALGRNAQEYV
jgi:hypothetical protein